MVDSVGKPLAALKRRRRIALAGLFAIVVITIGSAVVVERSSSERQHELLHAGADRMSDADSLIVALQARAAAARGYLLSGSQALLDERRIARLTAERHVEQVAQHRSAAEVTALREAIAAHDAKSDVAIALRATDVTGAAAEWERNVRPAQRRVVELAERIARDERVTFAELRDQAAEQHRRARLWLIGSGLVVLLVVVWTVRVFLRMEHELVRHVRHEQKQEMFQLLEQVPVGIYVVTHDGKPYYANHAALAMLGEPAGATDTVEKLPDAYRAFEIGTDRVYPAERIPLTRALAGEKSEISDMEIRRDDEAIPLHVRGAPVVLDEQLKFAVAAFQDVRELRRIATRDALTGLPNRGAVTEAFTRERLLAERGEIPLALAMIDFDKFKSVNDMYGHAAGDSVLVRGGQVICRALRRTDLVARWGGEELLVLLPKATGDGARVAIEKALEAIRALELTTSDGRTFRVTFSAGVVEVAKGEALDAAMERADLALYDAKHGGRNRVVLGRAAPTTSHAT